MTQLFLAENDIRAKGAAAVAEMLKAKKTLTTLNLSSNRIRAKGASKMANALQVNHVLTKVDVGDIGLDERGC
jgi:Ran GTPase-activating protein (RanGAP) involved in mRNA processing and transport